MTILSNGLETFDYGAPGWNHIYNRDVDLLEDVYLKLNALQDVDVTGLQDGDGLVYDSAEQKWIRVPRP